ncbi:hypothetical protein ACVHNB_34165 [Streptomyces sp. YJ-C3]
MSVPTSSVSELLSSVLLLSCIVIVLLAVSYVPVRRWLHRRVREPIRRWRRRAEAAVRVRYEELVNRLMGRTISQVAPALNEVLSETGLRARPLVVEATLKWWRAALWAIPARAVSLALLAYGMAHVEGIVDFIQNPEKYSKGSPGDTSGGPGRPRDPVSGLIRGMKDAVSWMVDKLVELLTLLKKLWPLELPSWGVVTPLVYVAMTLSLLVALKALYPILIALTNGARRTASQEDTAPRRPRSGRHPAAVDDEQRYRPVVVLLLTSADCARAWQAWGNGSPLDTPRVSVRRAEHVIRNAWRTRCEYDSWSARRRHRHAHRVHAAKVIGALREVERRQYTEPDIGLVFQELADMLFQELADMLLSIAERYAEGRIGQLLEDVDDVEAVTDYEWLRLLGAAAFGVAAVVAASLADLPEGATGLVAGLALLLGGSWLFRHRLTHPMELMDVLRGADRK